MSSGRVTEETRQGVVRLVLNRPEKRNALDRETVAGLKDALRRADADPGVRAVILGGAGPDFCAGADLAELGEIAAADVARNLEDVDQLAELFLLLRRLRKPVVAGVQGRALAGGCGLATACDLVVAEEGARFGYPEVRIGFVPAMVIALLRRNVAEKRAFELICLGETLSAAEARDVGLVNRLCPDGEIDGAAFDLALALASRSATAVQLCKRLLYQTDAVSYESAIEIGAGMNVLARMTEDTREGIRGFLDRRR